MLQETTAVRAQVALLCVTMDGAYMDKGMNGKRLVGLVRLFDIPISTVAKLTGKSRSFVSRIINGDTALGGDDFYREAELKLGAMIEKRSRSYFNLPGVDVGQVDGLVGE